MSFSPKRVSELASLASVASGDYFVVVDISDTAAGTTKKVTLADFATSVIAAGNITAQGNTFNGASQLVQLDSSSRLPAADGSLLTGLNASSISSGTVSDARLSANVTVQGNTFNGASQLVRLDSSTRLPAVNGSQLTNLNASNLNSGTIPDARQSSSVTMQGNTFNGAGALVQLDGSSKLPAVDGSQLTNLNASELITGTVADARLSANVVLRTGTILAVNTAGTRPLATADADGTIVVGHTTGTVVILCTTHPQFLPGMKTKVFCNTAQDVDIAADTGVTVYYIDNSGAAASISPSATLNLSAVRGRVITITCVAINTYFIEGALL
jgi:hypothetical protein